MRLIDADELLKAYEDRNNFLGAVLVEAPTIDAVPVIRCKECKYYQQGKKADDWLWCMMNHHYTDDEKYCAWAERKDE